MFFKDKIRVPKFNESLIYAGNGNLIYQYMLIISI